ncbi:hypothetical protein AB0G05_24100 [Nonomuraea wenchangensis]
MSRRTINGVGRGLKSLDAKFEGRFETVNNRLDSMDARLVAVETGLEAVGDRLGVVQETQRQMLGVLVGIQRRLEAA